MLIQPIDYFLVAWFAVAILCTIWVGWDQFRNNPEPAVMKWGFVLVTLYMGPLGLLLGLPMRIDLIVEYLAGFAFGLFIFQSLFMKAMMGGTY